MISLFFSMPIQSDQPSHAMFAFSAQTWLKDLLSHVLHKHIFCFSVYRLCSLSNHAPPHCTSPSLFLPVLLLILPSFKRVSFTADHTDETHRKSIRQYKQIYIKQTLECANIRSAELCKIRIRSKRRCFTYIGNSRPYLGGFSSSIFHLSPS